MSNTATTIEAEVGLAPLSSSRQRLKTWGRVLSHFLAGQACLQAVNAVTGLLLLRWLTVTAYAQFSVAFGFQSMIGMFVDLGFSGSIVALVGDRGHDAEVVGRYISSAQHFRRRMFVVMAIVSLVVFPLLTYKQHWDVTTSVLLLATILASVFFQSWGMYTAPLLINRRLKEVYTPQVASGVGRGVLCFLLHTAGALSAWTTAVVSTATLAYNGLAYRRASRELAQEPTRSEPAINREMIRYLAPLIPGIIFTALQGQITLAVITVFGHTTSIAEVAALGRLGQLFLVLVAFNGAIVEPLIARTAQSQLLRRYVLMLLGAITLASAIFVTARFYPELLLWLLGPKYRHLKTQIPLIVLTACVNYVAGVIWTMNSARKWIYWWYTWLLILAIIVTQFVCVWQMNLSTTHEVLLFGLIVCLVNLSVHLTCATHGLLNIDRVYQVITKDEEDDEPRLKAGLLR